MDDREIIRLYWDRDQRAIEATAEKYGALCAAVAKNILDSPEDAEECVNDTWLMAWSSMPEQWPERLPAYLCRITRNLACKKYRRDRAGKRGGGELPLILEELAECVSDRDDAEKRIEGRELTDAVNAFVRALPEEKRLIFLRRYWYADQVADIARALGAPPGRVSKALERMRKQLKRYLAERGFDI